VTQGSVPFSAFRDVSFMWFSVGRNEYQKIFLGVKCGWRIGLTA
jgi:hypothetical protein